MEEYSERSRNPKASKMDLQMSSGCLTFSKKSKVRFEYYLLHFRPPSTLKSDPQINQQKFENQLGFKHCILSVSFHAKTKPDPKNCPQRVPKGWGGKWWNFGFEGPLAPRLIPEGRNSSMMPFLTTKSADPVRGHKACEARFSLF